MTKAIWTIVFAAATLSACASYTPTSQPIPQIEKADWTVVDGLAAAVDPYIQAERQKTLFDADLTGSNVLAIQLTVENGLDRAMLVRPSDVQLVLPDGRAYASSNVNVVVSTVGESGSVVGSGIAFGLIGVLVASNAEESARKARTFDYSNKSFVEKYLTPGEQATGVVFFIPSTSICEINEATLRVKFVDPDNAKTDVVDVLMAGLEYEEIPPDEEVNTSERAGSEASDEQETAKESGPRCRAI